MNVPLFLWSIATGIGLFVGILAALELRQQWDAVRSVQGSPYASALRAVVFGNTIQQSGRMLIDILCAAAAIISIYGNEETRGAVIVFLLVGFRIMATLNSAIEYISNVARKTVTPAAMNQSSVLASIRMTGEETLGRVREVQDAVTNSDQNALNVEARTEARLTSLEESGRTEGGKRVQENRRLVDTGEDTNFRVRNVEGVIVPEKTDPKEQENL